MPLCTTKENSWLAGRPCRLFSCLSLGWEIGRWSWEVLPASKSAQLLSRFAALLAQGFNAQLGVSDYAARLDVTPTHLTRICREITGRTALALINEVLMAEARRRLVDTDDSAAKIARDLGYSSPAYFTRAFGQETGTTPTGYREQKRGNGTARATDSPCFP